MGGWPAGQGGIAEAFDVDCTAPVRPTHLVAMNRLLPEGLRILRADALVPQAPSLGKLVAAAGYLIGASGDGGWPADPAGLAGGVGGAVRRWEPLADGRLRVELNLREDEGPVATAKELLIAAGVDEARVPLVRVTRERLVLRPRAAGASSPADTDRDDSAAEGEP